MGESVKGGGESVKGGGESVNGGGEKGLLVTGVWGMRYVGIVTGSKVKIFVLLSATQ